MTRAELIEAIIEDTKNLSPEERKARRKKWAKRAAIGAGAVGAGIAGAYYGPKLHHMYGQRKIKQRVMGNIARQREARQTKPHEVVQQNPDKRRVGWWANENAVFLDLKQGQPSNAVNVMQQPSWKALHRHVKKHTKTRQYNQYWDDNPKPQHPTRAEIHSDDRTVLDRVLRRKRVSRVLVRHQSD